jgi:hypothetical protein
MRHDPAVAEEAVGVVAGRGRGVADDHAEALITQVLSDAERACPKPDVSGLRFDNSKLFLFQEKIVHSRPGFSAENSPAVADNRAFFAAEALVSRFPRLAGARRRSG